MKKQGFFSKMTAYVLTLCMLVTGLWSTNLTPVKAAESTTVYFLNTEGWSQVYGYVYADGTTVGTGWPGDAVVSAPEVGNNWWKLTVARSASTAPFNVIFNNNSGSQVDAYITKDSGNYMTFNGTVYDTKSAAESAMGIQSTTVYFLNSEGWSQVYGYVYADGTTVGTSWPGDAAVSAPEVGNNWWKLNVARNASTAPFNIIFNDNGSNQVDAYITSDSSNFMTTAGTVYNTSAEAEAAVGTGSETETETEAAGTTNTATVYYYNANGWSQVYAYVYANGATVGTEWPGVAAESAGEIGTDWWKVTVERNAETEPFNIIFNNNSGTQVEAYISQNSSNYMAADGTLYTTKAEAEATGSQESSGSDTETDADTTGSTTVYFLNSEQWASVGAYVYGAGEALGPWPGTTPVAATELGDLWLKVEVPAVPAFNIIFFNTADDTQRAELQIPSADYVYVTGNAQVYSSQLEAEISQGMGDLSQATTVYFYNNRGWSDVYGYTYTETDGTAATIGSSWPGSPAIEATEVGSDWWKIVVPRVASESNAFKVIFNDGMNQTEDLLIQDRTNVYVTAASGLYGSAAQAEEAAANDNYDDGSNAGPNEDLNDYDVVLSGAGATLPYTTYEAEDASTNATILPYDITYRETIQSEASGRQAVKLANTGDYVEFTLTEEANAFVLRYCMPDSTDGTGIDASLSVFVNGTEAQDLALTSKYALVYGSYPYTNTPSQGLPHRFFDEVRGFFHETLPAGTTVRLQKTSADTAEYYVIDFIECELVEAALAQPADSLSILDYGAVANDGQDDYNALVACIADAASTGKTVWIPAGTFNLVNEVALDVNNVTIQGAGMWYTNLVGAGVSFHYQGTCKFYDFAMTGVSTVRDDSGDLAGFEGVAAATNVTIENIWMEHIKVGVWSSNTTNLVIQGCRIRNTYADGINLCSGTNGATVRNNSVRNTGDDGIAIWPWLADCTNNTIAYNTVQVPTLANGIAIYGGNGNTVECNHVCDTINNGGGICVSTEFATKEGYSGTITVRYNVLERCGSYHTDYGYPVGAIWIWSTNDTMDAEYKIYENTLYNSSYEGILIDGWNTVTNVEIKDIEMYGGTDGLYVRGNAVGSAEIGNITMQDTTGTLVNNENTNFTVTINNTPVETEPETSEEETSEAESESSEESSTETEEPSVPEIVTPSKVTGVQAVYENGQIKLTWDDNGAARYRVMRFDGITSGYTTLTYRATADGYIDTDLIDVHRYYYRICGYFYDADGNLVQGGVSDAVGVVATDREPSKVENVQAAISDGNVILTWDAADGVRYYKIARAYGATAAEGSYSCLQYNVEETTYTDTTVSAGNWRYKVVGYYKAVDNSWVYGDMSATLFLTVE